jgi:aryl-alcohol dehydrogenase-like predicted oxidoreductase
MAFFKPYSLGTMMMAWRLDKSEARKVVASAIDNNITLMDTSLSYARGACHAMLSDVIKELGCVQKIQIATKVGGVACDSDPEHFRGLSGFNIQRQCDLSLQQLGVDVIDLLQLHFYEPSIALEQQVETLQNLQRIGKIKAWGVCNYSANQMIDLYQCAKKLGGPLPVSNQVQFNLIDNKAAIDLPLALEKCKAESVVWGALSSGLLSNRTAQHFSFDPNCRISLGREKEDKLALLANHRTRKILYSLIEANKKTGASISQLAIAWIKRQGWVNSILLGPSSLEQFQELIAVQNLNIDPVIVDGLV